MRNVKKGWGMFSTRGIWLVLLGFFVPWVVQMADWNAVVSGDSPVGWRSNAVSKEMVGQSEAEAFKNAIGMEFVLIPAGKFVMGSNKYGDEQPMHEVTIGARFYLGKYEVTQGEWELMMGSNPSRFKGDDRLPVENVSWDECRELIKKLNERKDGYVYRLPSEAEWEYACRAGTTGDYAGELDAMGWYGNNSGLETHPVGEKKANAWGLHDMHGSVWEWCQDQYLGGYNGVPNDGSAWKRGSDNDRVLRGGSWYHFSDYCRSAVRYHSSPDDRYDNFGFRLVAVSIP